MATSCYAQLGLSDATSLTAIKQRTAEKSFMPEGLLEALGEREQIELLKFLTINGSGETLGWEPRKTQKTRKGKRPAVSEQDFLTTLAAVCLRIWFQVFCVLRGSLLLNPLRTKTRAATTPAR